MSSIVQNQSALKQFLQSIAHIKGDLSNITAPPFVLADKSAVEFPASWAEHPSILCAPAAEEDPKKRALLVLKWYLSSLRRQQYSAGDNAGVKKPLNAFLGELFIAQFDDDMGTTKLISEQVSHHPPVTACYLWNEKHGVRAEGYTRQEVTLSRTLSVRVNQIGHATLHIDNYKDSYLVTLPTLTVKGLLSGTPYPELDGITYISSSTGMVSKIEYEGKGWLSGQKNTFKAVLYHRDAPDDILYSVEGQWNATFTFRDEKEGKDIETYDTKAEQPTPMTINNVDEQDHWESRKAWKKVIEGVRNGDMRAISEEKHKVEQAQRDLRRREEAEGTSWQQAVFSRHQDDPLFHELASPIGAELRQGQTDGVWKFDTEKASKAQAPYHGDLTPLG